MEQVKTQEDQAENGRRFSQEQYDMLLRCSEKKDMTEWNNWRDARRGDDICLDGASFYEDTEWKGAFLRGANLKHNPKTGWDGAVYLRNAKLQRADLEGAELVRAHLEQADLWLANVKGVDMGHAHLQGTQANMAVVDEGTLLWQCKVDKKTNFSGVGLGNVRIDSATKQLLEYNIRRKNWENWYGGTSERKWVQQLWKALTVPVRLFWLMSDYGHSTWTVFFWFGALAIVFAVAYWNWPSFVRVNGVIGDFGGFIHALYFSVVTMTTLGFGDIAANPDSWGGQVLLMIQVILGYVILGVLITRLAVLLTGGGPAGTFSEGDE